MYLYILETLKHTTTPKKLATFLLETFRVAVRHNKETFSVLCELFTESVAGVQRASGVEECLRMFKCLLLLFNRLWPTREMGLMWTNGTILLGIATCSGSRITLIILDIWSLPEFWSLIMNCRYAQEIRLFSFIALV